MDMIDQSILDCLKANGRATASEIGRVVSLSVPAVSERIRKLEQSGVIEGYTVRINRHKTGHRLLAFVMVGIGRNEYTEGFKTAVVKFEEVLECHHIAGEYDYLLKTCTEDTQALDSFLSNLKKIRGVSRTNTAIALSSLKEEVNR